MKDLNSMEHLLNSLKPRGPSARLRNRLFVAQETVPDRETLSAILAQLPAWLFDARHALWTAASAVFLAACLLDVNVWVRNPVPDKGFPVLAAMSNESWTASLSTAEVGHNVLVSILGWTNEERIPSTIRSLETLNTNDLLRRL
jgi:hypothetical protein